MTGEIRRRVVVSGRVQGVWFRDSLRRRAERAGVGGWARNMAEGTVEAVFEGPGGEVEQLVAWCRLGPPDARVEDVEVVEEQPEGLRDFEIR